ncbi:hypothetical protein Hdeb2414_s0002g00070411 [Helianthus debilis subsp. tardiflorus]
MAQFGLLNNGIRVRDPSQMFMFGSTKWSHESTGLLTKNKSQQAGIFSKPFAGNQSSGSVDKCLLNKEDDKMFAVAEASSSDENQPNFGLTPTTPTQTQSQRPLVHYFDPFGIAQQMVKKEEWHFKKPSQSPVSVKNRLLNQNHTSRLVSVKNEDGQQLSTRPANISLRSPVQQNKQNLSVTGSCQLPSTSYAGNSRIRKLSCIRSLDSKKRKFSTFKQNKEVTEGSSRQHDISTAELEWEHSAGRIPEKLNALTKETEESHWMIKRKRRLILTTQLMQLLFQPPPANILSEDAIAHCDAVTYYASKLAQDSTRSLHSRAGKNMTSKRSTDQVLLKVIEGFIDRSKRLADDFSRVEKGKGKSLMLEVMMDCQDLDKFSFINRFAKFHSRRPMVTSDSPSSTMPKPERHVKAIPMPKMVPEGQNCLLL